MRIKFYRYAKTGDPNSVRSQPFSPRGKESLPLEIGVRERAGLWLEIQRLPDTLGIGYNEFDAEYPHLAMVRKEIERTNAMPDTLGHLPISDEPHECEGHAYQPSSSEPIEVDWS